MDLHRVILNQNKKIDTAIDALKAERKYRQDKVERGLQRVDMYVEDIEGDWLEQWSDSEETVTSHKLSDPAEIH